MKQTTEEKLVLFSSIFHGLESAYGTYDSVTGKYWQVKEHITQSTIYNHLKGIQPYGFYPLTGELTSVGVVDLDINNPQPAFSFIRRARHYEIHCYLERSKSK